MPLVIAGHHVTADITFAEDCATVAATDPELGAPAGEAVGLDP
jgi:hypothetical protein